MKRYDRNFLLKFQKSYTAKPLGLKKITLVFEKRASRRNITHRNARRNAHRDAHRDAHTKSNVCKLERDPNAWNPLAKKSDLQKLRAELRGLLNKLAVDTYPILIPKITKVFLENTSSDDQCELVKILYQKAVLELEFCGLYAQVCHALVQIPNFRETLLNVCQTKFTTHIEGASNDDTKYMFVGCMRFVVHLYAKQIIPLDILDGCCAMLLGDANDLKIEILANGLFQSLHLIYKNHARLCNDIMNFYKTHKQKLRGLQNTSQIKPRIKFMIMDVVDLFEK